MNKKILKSQAVKISLISIAVNLALAALKLAAGLIGNSQALVADSVHSASDVLSTVIVIVSLVISSRAADSDHEYGHQKYESLASLFLALMLAYVGIRLGMSGIGSITSGSYLHSETPALMTVIAAAVSIIVKEVMYHITMRTAKKTGSSALKADAWHHRSDALSSIGSLIGVLFAMFGYPVMDPVASIIICVLILKTALDIGLDSVKALTDSACDENTQEAIRECILSDTDVLGLDMLKSRIFGSGLYVDVEIEIDSEVSFEKAHSISEDIHDKIEKTFPNVWHCMVHANPVKKTV